MNLENYYYYFKSAIPLKICDDILNYGKKHTELTAVTGDKASDFEKLTQEEKENVKDIRKSKVVWLNDEWIYKEIHPYINEANKLAGWNFDWDWSENCQFTKYEPGQYYGWHCDSHSKPYSNINDTNYYGKIRKLSVTLSLNDGNEYEGGDLEFDFRNTGKDEWSKKNTTYHLKKCDEIKSKGSLVVFPSFVWHRVTPVTKGTRYSLVIWNLGYPFK